jgi:hypothetical protein
MMSCPPPIEAQLRARNNPDELECFAKVQALADTLQAWMAQLNPGQGVGYGRVYSMYSRINSLRLSFDETYRAEHSYSKRLVRELYDRFYSIQEVELHNSLKRYKALGFDKEWINRDKQQFIDFVAWLRSADAEHAQDVTEQT